MKELIRVLPIVFKPKKAYEQKLKIYKSFVKEYPYLTKYEAKEKISKVYLLDKPRLDKVYIGENPIEYLYTSYGIKKVLNYLQRKKGQPLLPPYEEES